MHHKQSKKSIFKDFLLFFVLGGQSWRVGVVNVAALACVLRATTKKVVNFLRKKVHPQRTGYAYGQTYLVFGC